MAQPVEFSGIAEAAFLHHTARGWVIHEVVAPEGVEALRIEAVVYHLTQRFGA